MKTQGKWFAMLGAAGIGALLLMSLFAGSALAQITATPTPMTMQPANPNLRRGLPVITSTVTMTVIVALLVNSLPVSIMSSVIGVICMVWLVRLDIKYSKLQKLVDAYNDGYFGRE